MADQGADTAHDRRKKRHDKPDKAHEEPGGVHADTHVHDDGDIPTGTSGPSLGGTSLSPTPPPGDTEKAVDKTHHDDEVPARKRKKHKRQRDD